MTLNEKIVACARSNGYKGDNNNPIRPTYTFFPDDMGEWWLKSAYSTWRVTDEDFKKWERDYKINEICK
jgi:hypothetical protein